MADVMPVARYDARGHGRSDSPMNAGRCVWPEMGTDMWRLARALGRRRAVLGGTSMGAAASLFAALEEPSLVEGLILATPPTCYETRQKFTPMYREFLEVARTQGLAEAKRVADGKPRPPIFAESQQGLDMWELGWKEKFAMGQDRYCQALEGAIASDLPQPELLRSIRCPVLLLAWVSDPQHPSATAETLQELLPNAELHVANSWAEIEAFPKLMRAFLMRIMAQA